MKVLVVSLLRLGDLLMHQQIVKDIRKTHPGCELHLVLNEQFESASELLPFVDKFHVFPRNFLQKEMVETQGSFFRSYGTVLKWLDEINLEKFAVIYDLSHTFLSHKLMDLLEAPDKKSSVPGYFNDVFSLSKHTSFHYVDALRSSLKIQAMSQIPTVEKRSGKNFSIQPLTSDAKKNWGIPQYQRLIEILVSKYPECQISILGAPFEEENLKKYFTSSQKIKVEILNLRDLEMHLWDTALLISGDTATIHLAAQCKTPHVGIYIGSSDPFQTAPYIVNSVVLHSLEACAPCGHSNSCSQVSHLCGESMSAEDVSDVVINYLDEGADSLTTQASRYPFKIYRTRSTELNELVLEDLSSLEETVRSQVHQVAWRCSWKKVEVNSLGSLLNQFQNRYIDLAVHVKEELDLQKMLNEQFLEMEKWAQSLSQELLLNRESIEQDKIFPITALVREWSRVSPEEETTALLKGLIADYNKDNSFSFYKKARFVLTLVSSFLNSKSRIYENLRNQLREKGYNYVSGPGKLS